MASPKFRRIKDKIDRGKPQAPKARRGEPLAPLALEPPAGAGRSPSPPLAVPAFAQKNQGRDLSDPGPESGHAVWLGESPKRLWARRGEPLAPKALARKNLEVGDESENWSPALGAIGERRAMKAETRR